MSPPAGRSGRLAPAPMVPVATLGVLLATGLIMMSASPARAGYACAVRKTPDGHVALRAGPSARHPEVGRMKPQELVGLLHPPAWDAIVRRGDWLFVRWSPGTRRTADHIPDEDDARVRTGWVRDRLIDCFE